MTKDRWVTAGLVVLIFPAATAVLWGIAEVFWLVSRLFSPVSG